MVADNIREYMKIKLNISADVVEEKCRYLYLQYGTTLAGLVVRDIVPSFRFVHSGLATIWFSLCRHLATPSTLMIGMRLFMEGYLTRDI